MESFYGVPRQPPVPPTINQIGRVPAVPEVSTVENPIMNTRKPCGENVTTNAFAYMKQARFESSAPEPLKTAPDLSGKTFKQIYMANVPDRHLDLSLFEPHTNLGTEQNALRPVQEPADTRSRNIENHYSPMQDSKREEYAIQRLPSYKPKSVDNVHKPPLVFKRDDYATKLRSIENVPSPRLWSSRPKCSEMSVQTDEAKCSDLAPQNDEPTIRDLFKIIQQQNEQIMLLQRQVGNLKSCMRQPEIEPNDNHTNSPTRKGLFSFDVKRTSIEFSFRAQQKLKKPDFLGDRIEEITENTENNPSVLRLDQDSFNVKNSYVSEVPSIEIKMDDYHSSDDDDASPGDGLTFYKDLMEQVNKVLKRVQRQSELQPNKRDLKLNTMNVVKEATLQHLKNIGVNLVPIQESSETSQASSCNESEVSQVVQELLMKYLPEDKLVKAATKPIKPKRIKPHNRAEFSFETLEYMKKYNILESNIVGRLHEVGTKGANKVPKILDVTALKMQPKLL